MDAKDRIETLKILAPVVDGENSIYSKSWALMEWYNQVLPLLTFAMPLYDKFELHFHRVPNVIVLRSSALDNSENVYIAHVKEMIAVYNEAISVLERSSTVTNSTYETIKSFCKNHIDVTVSIGVLVALAVAIPTFLTYCDSKRQPQQKASKQSQKENNDGVPASKQSTKENNDRVHKQLTSIRR